MPSSNVVRLEFHESADGVGVVAQQSQPTGNAIDRVGHDAHGVMVRDDVRTLVLHRGLQLLLVEHSKRTSRDQNALVARTTRHTIDRRYGRALNAYE